MRAKHRRFPAPTVFETLEDRRLFVAYAWVAPAGGMWGVPANWAPFGVPGAADTATIVLAGAYTVTIPGNAAVLGLTVGDGGIGGPGMQRLTVGGFLNVAGATTVDTNGYLEFTTGTHSVLRTGSLAILGTGLLDLKDNDAIVGPATPIGVLEGYVKAARNGGLWNAPGLTSAAARNQPNRATGLGVLKGVDYIAANAGPFFDGYVIGGGDSLIKYTWYGDTDFNGKVNFDDYVRIDVAFNDQFTLGPIGGWFHGDSDLNGKINFDDYALIDASFNVQGDVVLRPGSPSSSLFEDLEGLIQLEKETS